MSERLAAADDRGERTKVERQLKTIERVRCAAVRNPKVLLEFISPSETPSRQVEPDTYFLNLDDAQKRAVAIALDHHVLSLIQGPPGTGKTQVIAEICLQLYRKNPEVRILVCSETHIAVNNLISRISEYDHEIRIVRIRDKEQNSAVDAFAPEAIIGTYGAWLQEHCSDQEVTELILASLGNCEDKSLEKALALSANVTGMTCNRVNAYELTSFSELFDVVIVDEVCKATLPEILAPLTVAEKAILVGDPKQLPPVFCSEELELIRSIDRCNLQSYQYIDKLFSRSQNVTMLDTQYRMTNQIGTLIGDLFYSGQLKNGRNADVENGVIWIDYTPTEAWPISDESGGEKSSLYNADECEIISAVLTELNARSAQGTTIALIAPYKAQVTKLRNDIQTSTMEHLSVRIDTVDGFQGKESDMVIFSLTRTVGPYRFLADERRLNVALSRARDRIIVVGNLAYAVKNKKLDAVSKAGVIQRYERR